MREWKQKRSNMRHYDRQAAIYDVQYVGEQNAKIDNLLKRMKLGSNELVLDVGCGTGFLFQHISKNVGLLVGVDVSAKALMEAKKRTKNMPNIVLVRADADNTPFPDNIFDKIFAITVLQNMPDPKRTIEEMKRTGKSQAVFAVTGLKKKFTQESFGKLLKAAQLKVSSLESDERLKGYIAVCTTQEIRRTPEAV
jgi:ubiquinone/menaquinone biosynthesis C-methylase UbiE